MEKQKSRKIARQRRVGLMLVSVQALLGVLIEQSRAYQWIPDRPLPPKDITWRLNPRDCPDDALGTLLSVSEVLSHYLPQSVSYGGRTTAQESVDGQYTIRCMPILDFMGRGYGFTTAGVTLVGNEDADIIFSADMFNWQVALHEMVHMLGLDHSDVSTSAVCAGKCSTHGRLDRDDLLGLASLYGAPPNCTPYVSEDLTAYFPSVGGKWAELKPVDPANLSRGFYIAESGISEGEWECDLEYTSDSLAGTVYHQGELLDVQLRRDGGLWYLD